MEQGEVEERRRTDADVDDRGNEIKGDLTDGTRYKVNYVKEDAPNVINEMRKGNDAGAARIELATCV